jgi:hypothetical protein
MNEPIFDGAWLKISMCGNAGKSWRLGRGQAVDNSGGPPLAARGLNAARRHGSRDRSARGPERDEEKRAPVFRSSSRAKPLKSIAVHDFGLNQSKTIVI